MSVRGTRHQTYDPPVRDSTERRANVERDDELALESTIGGSVLHRRGGGSGSRHTALVPHCSHAGAYEPRAMLCGVAYHRDGYQKALHSLSL